MFVAGREISRSRSTSLVFEVKTESPSTSAGRKIHCTSLELLTFSSSTANVQIVHLISTARTIRRMDQDKNLQNQLAANVLVSELLRR